MSALATKFEAADLARDAAEAAVRANPDDASLWLRLGGALGSGGSPGPVRHSILGITRSRGADHDASIDAYRRAEELSPNASTSAALGVALLSAGRVEESIDVLRRSTTRFPNDPASWSTLGRAVAERSRRSGVATERETVEISAALSNAVALGHRPSAFHLLRHSIRFEDWETAFELATEGEAGPTHDDASLLIHVDDPHLDRPADWWYAAAWKLRSAGEPLAAHRARKREAMRRCKHALAPVPTVDAAWHRVRSLVVLDALGEAADVIQQAKRLPDPSGRLDRLDADLQLRQGSPQKLVDWTNHHDTGLPSAAESTFRGLVTGKNVVIVGPNTDLETRQSLHRRFDLVVDTKLLDRSHEGRCARVSYYADTSLAMFDDKVRVLLTSGGLTLAIARPTFLASKSSIADDRIRIMPSEDSLASDGSHFGIARAVYDIIRVAPSTITLVGVDMFTAAASYPPGYISDRSVYARHQIARGLPAFNHDLADDHTFLARLFKHELVHADDVTSTVLRMTLDDYLDRLRGRTLA